ncbi:hypothetical protein ES708_28590 [subsurface metagenome]
MAFNASATNSLSPLYFSLAFASALSSRRRSSSAFFCLLSSSCLALAAACSSTLAFFSASRVAFSLGVIASSRFRLASLLKDSLAFSRSSGVSNEIGARAPIFSVCSSRAFRAASTRALSISATLGLKSSRVSFLVSFLASASLAIAEASSILAPMTGSISRMVLIESWSAHTASWMSSGKRNVFRCARTHWSSTFRSIPIW